MAELIFSNIDTGLTLFSTPPILSPPGNRIKIPPKFSWEKPVINIFGIIGKPNPGGVDLKATTTSLAVAGTGAAVSGLGAMLWKSKWGAAILGFGLAHVVLGLLDLSRPSVRKV